MVIAAASCGLALGLGYRGRLQVVNQIAAPDRRAEVISSYFVCVLSGNALPVVGIGVITTIAGATLASLIFAVMIMAFAFLTLAFAIKYANPD
jgi:hypothetical protein